MVDFEGKKTAVALGNFDGLHKGHLAVINEAVIQRDSGLLPCIVTFVTHPQKTLRGTAPKKLMTESLFEKEAEKIGCKTVKISFDEVRNMPYDEFFNKILIEKLNVGFVACGFNYRFGKNAEGNAQKLELLCKQHGIGFVCVKGVGFENESISSTRIRQAIENGEIENANKMLGRYFSFNFEVVHGDKIGARKLGFPTINQIFPEDFTVPKKGVYASFAQVDGKLYPAMTNIGNRPTVGGQELRSETCIIGFSGDLYGTKTQVSLISYIREEKKFPSVEALSEQLKKDSATAEMICNEVLK